MNVLSLFDGMSCGRIALERAGIEVTNYYASEIDKYAITVSRDNWFDITHIGDVTKVSFKNGWLYTEKGNFYVGRIDLLIGGSPCQGFSFAGKQLNFNDPRSALFFEYVRIMNEIKAENPELKIFLENVKMNTEYENIISDYLKTKPHKINSELVSAQSRNRLYWTNIHYLGQPKDRNILLKDIVDFEDFSTLTTATQNRKRSIKNLKNLNEKSFCMTATMYKLSQSNGMTNVNVGFGMRCINVKECERLQTVPDNYTSAVSNTQRYKMLGNGWTVDVIAHLFKPLKDADIL